MRVAVISDTHGLLRPGVIAAVAGVDRILHAGDVGDSRILDELSTFAPVTAVRGNVDTHGRCGELPRTEAIELAGRLIYMVHRLEDIDLNPVAAGISVVITGHSHKAAELWRDGLLYLNPGSVGPRRFSLPITMAYLLIEEGKITSKVIAIADRNAELI